MLRPCECLNTPSSMWYGLVLCCLAQAQPWVPSTSLRELLCIKSLGSCAPLLTRFWLLVGKLLGSRVLCFRYHCSCVALRCSQCVAAYGQVWTAGLDLFAGQLRVFARSKCRSYLQSNAPCQPDGVSKPCATSAFCATL